MPNKLMKPEFWNAVGAASSAIGDDCFYHRLLDVVGNLVENDLLALVRYSMFGAPDLVIPRRGRADIELAYSLGPFTFDPFHRYWQRDAKPAVKSLRQMTDPNIWGGIYARQSLHAAQISDQVAMFLPSLGGTSPALMVDRVKGEFSNTELSLLESTFPLLACLHEAHINAILGEGGGSATAERPRRLVDRSGIELVTNAAWIKMAADEASGLPDALTTLASVSSGRIILPCGSQLLRRSFAADFGAAPEGVYDVVVDPSPFPRVALQGNWLAPLTKREKEIVMLTLEGHPIAGIARRLGVERGTIKNHRMRLYQKLDITTERELFLAYMNGWHAEAAAMDGVRHNAGSGAFGSTNTTLTGQQLTGGVPQY